MKRMLSLLLAMLLIFSGCAAGEKISQTPTESESLAQAPGDVANAAYESRFDSEMLITLSDAGVKTDASGVFTSNDIVYYEDRDSYESGNPYGEGTDGDKHGAEEAGKHTVVNITKPGAYRVTGKLSTGQIRIDLGEDAYNDPNAVVELILDNADITCTVAPAILFCNVYECDGAWSTETAKAEVDTSEAGANLILEGENKVSGSYVARIYKDKEGEKKLWKQDGAIYSYMSMNVFGPGALELNAENEGMDTELHLTIHGGNIIIRSGNDGINTNEDGVSVTTINGGNLHIVAGLGEEGDGIDSNGYLVINGGRVISAAKPAADAGLDSDLGSYIHGGTVIALGSSMDWAESDSDQVTMNLRFGQHQKGAIRILREDGMEVFSFDPAADAVLSENERTYQGAILSCPDFKIGDSYEVFVGETQMMYTGTDVMMRPGGFGGGFGGERPDNVPPEGFGGQRPADMELPEGFGDEIPTWEHGEKPENIPGQMPDGERPEKPEGWEPGGFRGSHGEGDFGGKGGFGRVEPGEGETLFYMQDMVNFFSGLTAVNE